MFELAADWRATFHTDCIVDFICYRKFGHNEMDQPLLTQPFMYERVSGKRPVMNIYADKLVEEGTFSREHISQVQGRVWKHFERAFADSQSFEPAPDETGRNEARWKDIVPTSKLASSVLEALPTCVRPCDINKIATAYRKRPENFKLHRNAERVLESRIQTLENGKDIGWSTAEALAFGTLCLEGYHVRVSGQDVRRGTFSQRHAILHDQKVDITEAGKLRNLWSPLNQIAHDQGHFYITNSPLSEFSVLGFEYGYSLASPNALVMWEAQFGDFANNAQCIIDQFIVSGEAKWLQQSGLVLSLAHGYDGQGPEHSSARLERYLQMCNEDARSFPSHELLAKAHQLCNIQVVNATTPANLFHVLRRQMHRLYRKRKSATKINRISLTDPSPHIAVFEITITTSTNNVVDERLHRVLQV